MTNRREFLEENLPACAAVLAMSAADLGSQIAAGVDAQRFLLVGLAGSENPTRANFPFVWAVALKEAGYDVRIELAGDATVLMRSPVANNVTAVGWPPLRDALAKVVELKIPIFV